MDLAKWAGHWSEEACEGYRPFKPLVLGSNPSALTEEVDRRRTCRKAGFCVLFVRVPSRDDIRIPARSQVQWVVDSGQSWKELPPRSGILREDAYAIEEPAGRQVFAFYLFGSHRGMIFESQRAHKISGQWVVDSGQSWKELLPRSGILREDAYAIEEPAGGQVFASKLPLMPNQSFQCTYFFCFEACQQESTPTNCLVIHSVYSRLYGSPRASGAPGRLRLMNKTRMVTT
jgi:hypothetical protein